MMLWKWFQRQKRISGAVLFCLSLILIACNQNQPTTESAVQAPTTTRIVLAIPGSPATLPPTWTSIPVATSTDTPTPTVTATITLSPEPTETLVAETLCDNFELIAAPIDGYSASFYDIGGFSWQGNPNDSLVLLSLRREDHQADETILPYAPEEGTTAWVDMSALPGWGRYTWILSLYIEPYGEICPYSGNFYREPWWTVPIPNPLRPPFARYN